MPDEKACEQAFNTFHQALVDLLDWETSQYNVGIVLMHGCHI
ncbi:MAG TPA: hypothetical protein VFN23_14200 [Ktedonobacteraceae bacterium]|nr:hypothetical protein [Ktedonobacteraceae bacterium]